MKPRPISRNQALLLFTATASLCFAMLQGVALGSPVREMVSLSDFRMAHLDSLFNAFLLMGMAWAVPHLVLSPRLRQLAVWMPIIGAANSWWNGTLSAFTGRALAPNGELLHDVHFAAGTLLIAIPQMLAFVVWFVGAWRRLKMSRA